MWQSITPTISCVVLVAKFGTTAIKVAPMASPSIAAIDAEHPRPLWIRAQHNTTWSVPAVDATVSTPDHGRRQAVSKQRAFTTVSIRAHVIWTASPGLCFALSLVEHVHQHASFKKMVARAAMEVTLIQLHYSWRRR